MQFLLYIYYSLRSVVLRGPLNSLQLVRTEMTREKALGIKSAAIKRSTSPEFFHYQGAGYLVLDKIFAAVEKKWKGYLFVDIGCGKGRAVFVAEEKGFEKLIGIELDKTLVDIAEENLNLYKKRTNSSIRFLHANALDYLYENVPTVYFLFNPFSEAILDKVLDQLLKKNTNEKIFIYMNPLYPGPFIKRKMTRVSKIKTKLYTEALIFKAL